MNEQIILDRKLPANTQAEQMLLGAILINCELLNQVNEFLHTEHFFEVLHQKIYNAIILLDEKGLVATSITVKSMLEKDNMFFEAGGSLYLNNLTTMAMMVINPKDYGRIIYDMAIKRSLIKIGEDIVNNAYNSTIEISGTSQLEVAEGALYELASQGVSEKSFIPIGESVAGSMNAINRAIKNNDHVTGISTGLVDLDHKLSGFQNSDLVIIAGRPAMGKTAFAINFAFNACKALGKKASVDSPLQSVGFFSLEMSSDQISTRLLSTISTINSNALRTGKNLDEESYNRLRKASIELSSMKFFIDDTPALSISSVRARARKLKRKHNLGILFVDYLQLLRGSHKADNRVVEVSEITQGLKAIAKEFNIPVIALSQLSRAVEQREDKKPMLSDLRESGAIEQDADIVMFLYREEYYLKNKEPDDKDSAKHLEWVDKMQTCNNIAEIIIAKHRNGATGNIQLNYRGEFSSISDLTDEQRIRVRKGKKES